MQGVPFPAVHSIANRLRQPCRKTTALRQNRSSILCCKRILLSVQVCPASFSGLPRIHDESRPLHTKPAPHTKRRHAIRQACMQPACRPGRCNQGLCSLPPPEAPGRPTGGVPATFICRAGLRSLPAGTDPQAVQTASATGGRPAQQCGRSRAVPVCIATCSFVPRYGRDRLSTGCCSGRAACR